MFHFSNFEIPISIKYHNLITLFDMDVPERLQKWRDSGHYIDFKDMKIWVHTSRGESFDRS